MFGLFGKQCFQMEGDIARHHRGTQPGRFKGRHLFVNRADGDPFLVTEHRGIDGAGNMVMLELQRCADIDHAVEAVKFGQFDQRVFHNGSPGG